MNDLEQRLSVPYMKLRFSIAFREHAVVPGEKVSALRGGMGEMLLRQNCISDRDCDHCRYRNACIVHKTFYTQMMRKPPFMHGKDSVGYLIECKNYRTEFRESEGFFFYLVLFGDNIVYFGQYLQAFYQLGIAGIGIHKAKFYIRDICNIEGSSLMNGNQILMDRYCPETVLEYVDRRMQKLKETGYEGKLEFHTPLCLKYRGEYLDMFCAEAVFQALFRRIMMVDYFAGIYIDMPVKSEYPAASEQYAKLRGISGFLCFKEVDEEYLPYILAGELLHIGKNTSFGFGRYTFS